MKRNNLRVLTGVQVTRLLLEGKKCVGVEYEDGSGRSAVTAREIVLSAGAVGSPQILELSGIGSPRLLRRLGIAVTHELPAVGENLRDHINARMSWRVRDPSVSYNHSARGIGAIVQMLK
jgi:choline dehydrogenase